MTILKYNNNNIWRMGKYYRTEIKTGVISGQYERLMENEAAVLDPYFTGDNLNTMLEIGPGMGVFSALMHKKYQPVLHLIEGGGSDAAPDPQITVGWKDKAPVPCADIEALQSFLFENGIINFEILELLPDWTYRMIKDDKPALDTVDLADAWPTVKYDLIVSLRSWCWHYDADLYLDFVAGRSIPYHTLLLVDVRRDHGQPEKLFQHFNLVKEIQTGRDEWKMARLLMRAK